MLIVKHEYGASFDEWQQYLSMNYVASCLINREIAEILKMHYIDSHT